MIDKNTYSLLNLERLVKKYKRDKEIIARSIFALGLVEALSRSGANFIFKGGSALMLMFERIKRLSTDVDILVEPGYDIDLYLNKASQIFPFTGIKEEIRTTNKTITKRHFRLTYPSLSSGNVYTVLLDVLFAPNSYSKIIQTPVKNDLLICKGKDIFVNIPSPECLLGDKLTAFAPHTIGKPFYDGSHQRDGRLEVLKQFYDLSCLFDICTNFKDVRDTYKKLAIEEIDYRNLSISPDECLKDTFDSALCILSRGHYGNEEYPYYVSGFEKISHHIIDGRVNGDNSMMSASKLMLLSSCLLKGVDPFNLLIEEQELITDRNFNKINSVRKTNKKAFDLAVKAISIFCS